MKIEFSNGNTVLASGRSCDYECSAIGVAVNDWHPQPQKHAVEFTGYNAKGRLMKGDITIPIADAPALIKGLQELLHDYNQTQHSHDRKAETTRQ